ncbi:MAG: hypothetical protein OXU79_00570 [Gemmatimonadota bacterium]|nr:hypothetical protein [Gemmatimonadota bacterium]
MKSVFLLLAVLTLSRIVHAGDNTPDVPLARTIYRTLDRYDVHGWLDSAAPQTRPYTRLEAARLLIQVLRNGDAQAAMSATERAILRRHLASFSTEAARLGHAPPVPETGAFERLAGARYSWGDTSATVAVDALFRQRLILLRGEVGARETVSQTHVGAIVRGTVGDRIGFRARHYEAREWSTRPRLTRADVLARPIERVQFKGKAADFREATWQLVWAARRFAVDAAKGSLDWGPGRSGNLFMAPFAPTFGMARFRTAYRRVRFIHVLGFLEADAGLVDRSRTRFDNGHRRTFLRSKAIAAHRVEVDVSPRVRLGFQEAVIFGDRDFEFLYASPVSVLTAAQMAVGDRDNLAVGLDISLRPVNGIQTYLAFFMDDMRKFSPGDFSNKFAAQAGVFWVDAFGLPDTDLRAEFVHIEPFVYSHRFNINAYTHFDALLGYPTGPNSDRYWARLTHRFSPSVSAALSLEGTRFGRNVEHADGTLTNVGGDARQGRRPEDPAVREFMSGTVEKRTRVGVDFVLEPFSDLLLSTTYRLTRGSNVPLQGGRRGDGSNHDWRLTLDLNIF